jgi:hypothetical protein
MGKENALQLDERHLVKSTDNYHIEWDVLELFLLGVCPI